MKSQAARDLAFLSGGPKEDRTPDLRIANAALSQLSYRPAMQLNLARSLAPGNRSGPGPAARRIDASQALASRAWRSACGAATPSKASMRAQSLSRRKAPNSSTACG